MRNLVVSSIVLLLVVFGPQQGQHSRFDALWALGSLAIGAYVLQQVARGLHLPAVIGWLTAGLVMGVGGLELVRPGDMAVVELMRVLAAVWVGFQVGLHFSWPRDFSWKGPLLIGLVTVATLVLATVGIALVTEPPWWLALLLGTVVSLWGPFSVVPTPARRGALLLGTLGAGFSLFLLSVVLAMLQARGLLPEATALLVGRLWMSLVAGALATELLRRFGLFAARASTLAAGLLVASFVAALLIQQLQLYALPCGFGAGLVLVQQRVPARRMRVLLRSLSPVAFMIFFALVGATVDLRVFWPPADGLGEILVVELLVLVLIRGLGPMLYYPLLVPDPLARLRLGWMLLPRGALLFELIYHAQPGLLGLLGPHAARLLHQVALADMLIHILVFSTLARLIQHLFPPRLPSPDGAEETAAEAPRPA